MTLLGWAAAAGLGMTTVGASAATRYLSYQCEDAKGRRISQSEIPDCTGRYTGRDSAGRVVDLMPLTPEQVAAIAAAKRADDIKREAFKRAEREDLDLRAKFPNEGVHRNGRAAALAPVHQSMRRVEARLVELASERRPLDAEAEFYKGKPLPPELRRKIDANDAAVAAQKVLFKAQQEAEAVINANFDAQLRRLTALWKGEPPGSMGLLEMPSPPASPAKIAQPKPAR